MGAAHTAAVGIESVGNLDLGFPFEVEDGKDPAGKERWGRWGVLTNRDFGANIKPRYLAMRLMNRIDGTQLRLLGKGTWVKALATKNGDHYELLLANYDRYSSHTENVPVTWTNIAPGTYLMEITDLSGTTRKLPLTSDGTKLTTSISMSANSVMLVKFTPQNVDLNAQPSSTPTPADTTPPSSSPAPSLAPSSPGPSVSPTPPVQSGDLFGEVSSTSTLEVTPTPAASPTP
jgi:hypothetical protein